MNTVLYFAYGSNMSVARLKNRVSSVNVITKARLDNHQLRFHKRSRDGSGKCNANYVGNAVDTIYGVVFEMTVSQKRLLDVYEGLGNGYDQKAISVIASNGKTLMVLYYYATEIDNSLKPYEWYKQHVLQGAYEHGLPSDYIASIESIKTVPDLNTKRHERELYIYR